MSQPRFTSFTKKGGGVRLLHIHDKQTGLVDVAETSRRIYALLAANTNGVTGPERAPEKSLLYFEFDVHDSRYNTIESMLVYFINILVWRFWGEAEAMIRKELSFLTEIRAWSLEDLYHVYTSLRECSWDMQRLTFFINRFDRCPEHQRHWFLAHVMEEKERSDGEYRLILTSEAHDDLFADDAPVVFHINLVDSPAASEEYQEKIGHIDSALASFLLRCPLYNDLRSQLHQVLHHDNDALQLAQLALAWLEMPSHSGGADTAQARVNTLSPLTSANIVRCIMATVPSEIQSRAKLAFNRIKHAAEPWSPEALAEALVIYESSDAEPILGHLNTDRIIRDLVQSLGGIITVYDRNVKLSQASFYALEDLDIGGDVDSHAHKIHSQIAETCLRYFTLRVGRANVSSISLERLGRGPWSSLLGVVPISHARSNMADYATRFWPHHYNSSGPFKPQQMVHGLFATHESRSSWEVAFWLFSNPFTRPRQSYVGKLPMFARLGLEDLVETQIRLETPLPSFAKDCWLAVVEAAYANNESLVRRLLGLAPVDDELLGAAISAAAAVGSTKIADVLLDKVSQPEVFPWNDTTFTRSAMVGMDRLLAVMLRSGRDINKIDDYGGAPLVSTAVWRRRLSTVELLLGSKPPPDLTILDSDNDPVLADAVMIGDPRMVEMLLKGGAEMYSRQGAFFDDNPAMRAVKMAKPRALELLIKAGANTLNGGADVAKEEEEEARDIALTTPADMPGPLLHEAVVWGSSRCVCVLADNGADLDVSTEAGTALHLAVINGHTDIVNVLLERGVKPGSAHAPSGGESPLMRSINEGNTDIASLLLEHDAKVDYIEPHSTHTFAKTPLSRACAIGDLSMVKLLLAYRADINYIGEPDGEVSDPPLFTAAWEANMEVVEYMLKDERVDIMWAGPSDGLGVIHAAHNKIAILPTVLDRGAPINARSTWGTVLHMTARSNCHSAIEYLVSRDPKPDLEVALGDERPDDILHMS